MQKMRFSQKLSNLRSRIWAFQEPLIGPIKSKMAEIRRLENRHDVIFMPWAVRFEYNFADWCRLTCRLR